MSDDWARWVDSITIANCKCGRRFTVTPSDRKPYPVLDGERPMLIPDQSEVSVDRISCGACGEETLIPVIICPNPEKVKTVDEPDAA